MDLLSVKAKIEQYHQDHPTESDYSCICEAVWLIYGDGSGKYVPLAGKYDSQWVENNDRELYWVTPKSPGEQTILVVDGKVFIDTIDECLTKLKLAYAEKHGGVVCSTCGVVCHKLCVECADCGYYLDGSGKVPEVEIPEERGTCLQDGGSDVYRWVLKERLPTHKTESNHTWVFINLALIPSGNRYLGEFELPEQWCLDVYAVNVGMAGKSGASDAQRYLGIVPEDWKSMSKLQQAEALLECGVRACLHEKTGYSAARLLSHLLQKELGGILMMAGLNLDSKHNDIGSTGWDFMSNDLFRPVREELKRRSWTVDGR